MVQTLETRNGSGPPPPVGARPADVAAGLQTAQRQLRLLREELDQIARDRERTQWQISDLERRLTTRSETRLLTEMEKLRHELFLIHHDPYGQPRRKRRRWFGFG